MDIRIAYSATNNCIKMKYLGLQSVDGLAAPRAGFMLNLSFICTSFYPLVY